MVDGGQRGTLSARCYISSPHIVDHVDAGLPGEPDAVTDLYGQPTLRRMQHGLAVKPDHIDLGRIDTVIFQKVADSLDVQIGQVLLRERELPWTLFAAGQGGRLGQ